MIDLRTRSAEALCEVLGMPDAPTVDLLGELAARWRAIDAPIPFVGSAWSVTPKKSR